MARCMILLLVLGPQQYPDANADETNAGEEMQRFFAHILRQYAPGKHTKG